MERAMMSQQTGTASSTPERAHPSRRAPRRGDRASFALVSTTSEGEGPAERAIELARVVAIRIRARPLSTVVVALGLGFIVGGAASFRMGRIALVTAARYLARELCKQVL
jgi:hypothetical protein